MINIIENKHNCVYTAKSGGYIQLFIHKRYMPCLGGEQHLK